MEPSREVAVWDPLVRVGHWIVVVAFFVAYFTEDELLGVHSWAGYVVAAYVAIRVVWGFIGSEHARFSDFAYGPIQAARYLAALARSRAQRYLGHSPAGAVMVFALLFGLAGSALTGMAELAQSRGEGPLAIVMERRPVEAVDELEPARSENKGNVRGSGEKEESTLLELHEFFANLTLILVIFHIAGVALASWSHEESLVKAMFTGRKRAGKPSA
jgi:cytochrome b